MAFRIKIIGWANGKPCPHAGQYVQAFDFDAHEGRGYGEFTADPEKAMTFGTFRAALEFWRTTSLVKPMRPDGQPNRPLTAATVDIADIEKES